MLAQPDAARRRHIQDNLNTHAAASLYEAFPPAEARRLAERFGWHYTPKIIDEVLPGSASEIIITPSPSGNSQPTTPASNLRVLVPFAMIESRH
jgi:hypothetical protein